MQDLIFFILMKANFTSIISGLFLIGNNLDQIESINILFRRVSNYTISSLLIKLNTYKLIIGKVFF